MGSRAIGPALDQRRTLTATRPCHGLTGDSPDFEGVVAINGLGVTLIVAMDLEEAAATAARLNRWEFQFMVAPLQVTGGTGSPVHPIAVF